MKSITLIGYMCAGKTTIGKALGKALGRTFYDLDWYIEERFHRKVPQIFAEEVRLVTQTLYCLQNCRLRRLGHGGGSVNYSRNGCNRSASSR